MNISRRYFMKLWPLLLLMVFVYAGLSVRQLNMDRDKRYHYGEVLEEVKLFSNGSEETKTVCQPKTKIALAKTHKTGSSTIQNILLRYGVKNDLVFALPPNSWMFNVIEPFNANIVLDGPWKDLGSFDIFAFHCRWNRLEVLRIVPEATFITILRDPIATFESNYVYMGKQKALNTSLNEYARKFVPQRSKRGPKDYVGRNNLLWDLGLDPRDVADKTKARALIVDADRNFDLVMIMERMDESLILLADILCWDLADVAYIKQNERLPDLRNKVGEESKAILREWLSNDYDLYNHFLSKFERQIDKFGRKRMALELERLQELNARITKDCVVAMRDIRDPNVKGGGLDAVYRLEPVPDKPWCVDYTLRETEFCKNIRESQSRRVKDLKVKEIMP